MSATIRRQTLQRIGHGPVLRRRALLKPVLNRQRLLSLDAVRDDGRRVLLVFSARVGRQHRQRYWDTLVDAEKACPALHVLLDGRLDLDVGNRMSRDLWQRLDPADTSIRGVSR
jgi:hypothetical protein